VNELGLRSEVAGAIIENCEQYPLPGGEKGNHYAWCILNTPAQEKFGNSSLKFYK
jgi:hypothetical protein